MNEFKGTPGEWLVELNDDGEPRRIVTADGEHVTYVDETRFASGQKDPIALANARLISAAPDLLGALINIVDAEEMFISDTGIIPDADDPIADAIKQARAALNKALGERT